MPSIANLKALGLNFSPNFLTLPEGSLLEASNVIIRRDNIIESRRGYKLYGTSLPSSIDRAKQLLAYKGRILRHYSNLLEFDNGSGTFTAFSGNYSEVQSGLRMKAIEANGNFFFTTSSGIKKISASSASDLTSDTGFITQAGGIKAVDLTAEIKTDLGDQTSFFTADSTLAYRVVWGFKDANNNLILGAPSQRAEVYNSLQTLLIQDFLRLLGALDDINQSTSLVNDGNYVNTYKLPISASATDLYTNLKGLVTKLDNDLLFANDTGTGAPLNIDSTPSAIVSGVATITFTGDPQTVLNVGDKIRLAGFTTTTGDVNGVQTVTFLNSTTLSFVTTATGTLTPGVSSTINSNSYRSITEPSSPSSPATHDELIELQTYLQDILTRLSIEENGTIPTSLVTTYIVPIDLTTASTVRLEITVPQDITSSYFYQIYRSSVTLAEGVTSINDVFPNDELQLVYEAFPTQSELDAKTIIVDDVTPDEFRGANLYTNAISGEGILQANDLPPFAKDINSFKDVIFYANTKTRHRKNISLLGVTNMVSDFNSSITPRITIVDGSGFSTYDFIVGVKEKTDIICVADVADSLNGKYFTINSANNENEYYVWYKTYTGPSSDPAISGKTGIKVEIATGDSATTVATKTRDTLARYVSEFTATSSTSTVTIENITSGYTNDVTAGTSGFTITLVNNGRGEKITQEVSEITCVADVAGSLAGTYFTLNSAFNKNEYYIWFKVTGVGSDPAIANKTGIQVDLTTNDSASTVATKIKTKLDTSYPTKFTTEINTNLLEITNFVHGPTNNATAGTSGFTIAILENGAAEVLLSDLVSPARAVDETARSLVRVINKNNGENIYAYYLSGAQDVPGKMLFEARTLSENPIYILGNNQNTGNSFNPDITPTHTDITSITTGSAATMLVTTTAAHGLTTGDEIVITNSNSSPLIDGKYAVTVVGPTTFRLPLAITIAGTQGSFSELIDTEVTENETKPNRIYYSKTQQPEAVPIVNYFDVGPEDKAILRVFPLRDSLFVFKEDGLYRISGETSPFSKALFDSSCILIAPDSLNVANNQLYGWTTQGIVIVTEAGVSIISRPIDTDILKLSSSGYPNFKTITWGVGYESDNSYLVFTNKITTDTVATICYRYSNLTNSWTTFDKTNSCGIINPQDDKCYLGAGDTNYIEQERKSFSRYDYADREISSNLSENKYFNDILQLPSITNINVGDVVVQDQTLSVYEYNKILNKLDLDAFLADTNYYTTLNAKGGDNMHSKLDNLIAKIAADTGRLAQPGATAAGTYTALSPTASNFTALETNYNAMVVLLNADTGVAFTNYREIDNNTIQEAVILEINKITKEVTLNNTLEYIVGPLTVYNAITSEITYSPITMGDPLSVKQFRESTLMFINKAFTRAKMMFSSDLLPSDIEVEFDGDGSGIFGHQSFGTNFFGGGSHGAPFRTYVPRDKQRCRYLICKFEHSIAREQYGILGLTITSNEVSIRAYR